MSVPTIADMLKYANLQMATEALYNFRAKATPNQLPGEITTTIGHFSGDIDPNWLTLGNEHASRFAPTEAATFVAQWIVVDHLSNTTTGFSGTLFYNEAEKQYVISFRSTEFIDDVVRDCLATNAMEVKAGGWALGQIADMEAWYKSLVKEGGPLAGQHYSVTGYSLGGHLATAFNLLRCEDGTIGNVNSVVTFNGAGVGQITNTSGKLGDVLADFNHLREHPETIALRFADAGLAELYNTLRQSLSNGHTPTAADFALLDQYPNDAFATEYQQQQFAAQKVYLKQAMERIVTIRGEVQRLTTVTDTKDGQPANIPDSSIAQDNFEYQMAYMFASENTQAKALVAGGINTVFGKSYGSPLLNNQYDVVGRETTTTQMAMVADSQWHYGTNVDLFIEDQPLRRGTVVGESWDLLIKKDSLLPINNYTQNDFGDTHSLVLLVDSLNIQNLLKTLNPNTSDATLNSLLKAASNLKAESVSGQQGKAEGNVLENMLDGLSQIFTGIDPKLREGKAENGDALGTGNTWADKTLREKFYDQLNKLTAPDLSDPQNPKETPFSKLAGKVTVAVPGTDLASDARTDFAAFISLLTGSPVALKAAPGQAAAVAAILGAQWTDVQGDNVYSAWQADQTLSPLQRSYSDQFLQDRANYLSYRAAINLENNQSNRIQGGVQGLDAEWQYQDNAAGQTITVSPTTDGLGLSYPTRYVTFGSAAGDTLSGADQADHLYVGAGSDSLNGGAGDDLLTRTEKYPDFEESAR